MQEERGQWTEGVARLRDGYLMGGDVESCVKTLEEEVNNEELGREGK